MTVPNEKPTFYGSRCDRYDSTIGHAKMFTSFDEREQLLLQELKQGPGKKPTVGIPGHYFLRLRSTVDRFPQRTGVNVELSSRTNSSIIEQAVELSYSDSCFPIKLLHGMQRPLRPVTISFFPAQSGWGKRMEMKTRGMHAACSGVPIYYQASARAG